MPTSTLPTALDMSFLPALTGSWGLLCKSLLFQELLSGGR